MTDKQYLELARRTWSNIGDSKLHAVIGITTEASELLDAFKKHTFYGRELDIKNIKEEIGDALYYLQILCEEVGYSLDEAKTDNISKLMKRYPDGFKDVINRNQKEELSHI